MSKYVIGHAHIFNQYGTSDFGQYMAFTLILVKLCPPDFQIQYMFVTIVIHSLKLCTKIVNNKWLKSYEQYFFKPRPVEFIVSHIMQISNKSIMVDFYDRRGFFVKYVELELCVKFQGNWT